MPADPHPTDPHERLHRLRQALQPANPAACQACQASLDAYITAQLDGQDYTALYPEVALHLDRCLECAGAYARLYTAALAEQAGRLPHLERRPAPDLNFLRPAPQDPFEPVRRALQRLGERFSFQLSPQLLSLLQPAPSQAALRGPAEDERYGELLLSLEPGQAGAPDFPLGLKAYRDARQPELCLLEVSVTLPGRAWPDLAGIQVTLGLPAERRTALTGPWGLASFEAVPVAALVSLSLEIAP